MAGQVLLGVSSAFYLVASVLYQCHFFARWRRWGRHAFPVAMAALAVHTAGFVLYIVQTGHPPFTSIFESLAFFAWCIVVVYLVAQRAHKIEVLGSIAFPLAFVALVSGLFALAAGPSPAVGVKETPSTVLLIVHATPALLSYAAFFLALCAAVGYLFHAWLLRSKRLTRVQRALPSLDALDAIAYRMVAVGFPLLTVGIVAGAVWYMYTRGATRGDYWGWVTQEMWTMVTWLIYAVYLHARMVAGWKRTSSQWLLVAGFAVVLVTYLVAHLWLPGVHQPGGEAAHALPAVFTGAGSPSGAPLDV
ncbi:MAG: cytochrome c biogenesis protein CcsA [Armatimonadota bacterium]